ncbi:stage II sporulation protein E [Halanaerobacter jeridensis]|uniref:Stage II sporulation protein E n=1 Tax=Halanaerobacter jeridensis TaxID=706427 RepID=A0A938XST2_9FIRM|nr:stage II sporulation protein E [Halanaerobacter jeridensis]MBM7557174.1 stage II sporulation protein E [Halanaerobacter jeridensis]
MKGLDLPIYQRQNQLEGEKNNNSSTIINSVVMISIALVILGWLLGRGSILNNLMPFGISYFAIFLYFSNKGLVSQKKLALIFVAVNGGYLSYLGWGGSNYLLTSLCLWFVTINYLSKEIKIINYSLIVGGVFLIFKALKIYFFVKINTILLLAEFLLVFLLVLLLLRMASEMFGYLSDKSDTFLIALISIGLLFSLFLGDLAIENLWGINLLRVLSSYLIMLVALTGGVTTATSAGVLTGIFYSFSHLEMMPLVGNYALAGLLAGSFKKQNKLGVSLGFIISNLIYVIFLIEPGYIIALVKESVLASLFLLLTPKNMISYFDIFENQNNFDYTLEDRKLNSFINQRIKRFSHLFNELSIAFTEVATTKKEEEKNIGVFLDLITDKVCKKCDLYQSCWYQSFYDTYQGMFELLAIAENRGEVKIKDLEKVMPGSCFRKIKLTAAINQFVRMYELNSYWESKLKDNKKILLEQLSGMAKIIDDLSNELTIDIHPEQNLKTKTHTILKDAGLVIKDISVTNYNNEKLEFTIRKRSCNGGRDCINKMLPLLNNKLGHDLDLVWSECGLELDEPSCICQLAPGPKYCFVEGVATASSQKDISGDNHTFFKLKEDKFIAILSDGMGVGSKAFKESKGAVTLLKNMLQSGLDYESALKTINSILGIRSAEETFAKY